MLFNGVQKTTVGWVDDVTTTHAIEFIKKNKAQPFLAVVGFKSPHDPRTPPAHLSTIYGGKTLAPAVSANFPPPFPAYLYVPNPEYERQYMRTLKGVDENVGRLLAVLEQESLAQDTIVVYTSDNGYFLNEHGLNGKGLAYEESIRIPLLVRYPRLVVPGRFSDRMVLNIDIAPTFLELAGVAVPSGMQGTSLKKILSGQSVTWRSSFLYEHYKSTYVEPTMVGVRTATAKLVQYPGHQEWTQLFDLAADRYERTNVVNESAYAALKTKLEAELSRLKTLFGYTP